MTLTEPLILYTREACHLCELAANMLDAQGYAWRAVEVDADSELESRYGLSVPVVRRPDTGEELCYPFDEASLARLAARPTAQ